MRETLFCFVAVVMLGLAGPALALESGFDCAEGADEDLVTADSETTPPAEPPQTPTS